MALDPVHELRFPPPTSSLPPQLPVPDLSLVQPLRHDPLDLLDSPLSNPAFIPRDSSIYKEKHRSWVFTVSEERLVANGLSREFYSEIFAKGGIAYICCGYESGPTTSYKHIQGFIRFISPRTFESARRPTIGTNAIRPRRACSQIQERLSNIVRKEETGRKRETSPTSLFAINEQETLMPCRKKLRLNEKSSQTSRMEQLPLPLSQNDLSNMGLSLLSPDSRMPIGSALCRPKCCMCGAPQDWEKLRHSNQLLRDSLSDIIPSHPAIDGSMVTTTNQSSSSTNSSDVSFSGYQWNGLCNPSPPLLEVKGN